MTVYATYSTDLSTRLDSQRQEIHSIDAELEALEAKARVLRAMLAKSCEVIESLLAPIMKIPVEILAEIFLYFIKDTFLDNLLTESMNNFLVKKNRSPNVARNVLGLVCRGWQNVVLSTPRIWSLLSLTKGSIPNYPTVEEWFSRSCNTCLHIQLLSADIPAYWTYQECRQLLALIRVNLGRIQSLSVKPRKMTPSFTFEEIFPYENGGLVNLPSMELLSLTMGEFSKSVPPNVLDAPRLSTAYMKPHSWFLFISARTASSLTHLTLGLNEECHTLRLGGLLALCTNLETLRLGRCLSCRRSSTPLSEIPRSSEDGIYLPRLMSLSVLIKHCSLVQNLLSRLLTPNIEIVNLDMWLLECSAPLFQEALVPFFKQGLTKLRTLDIERIAASESRIQTLFVIIPQLEHLILQYSTLSGQLVSTLLFLDKEIPWRGLRTIQLRNCTVSKADMAHALEKYRMREQDDFLIVDLYPEL